MEYGAVSCADHTCPFNINGTCKFNGFEILPCDELSEEEFEELKINHRDNLEDKGEF